jgi:hypothetical protein
MAGGTGASNIHAGCLASREGDLADIIDAYVFFPDQELVGIPEDRQAHADCYAALDAALAADDSQQGMTMAYHGAADCVEAEMLAAIPSLVQVTVDALPDRTAAETEATIRSALEGIFAAQASVCGVVADASESAGGSMSRTYVGTCRLEAAVMLSDEVQEPAL